MSLKSLSLIILITSAASAQTAGNWTRQVPRNFPSPRSGQAVAYDQAHQEIVLFGGSNGSLLNDTWVWNGSNWTQNFPATSPPPRINHGIVYDEVRKQVVLFGGFVTADNPYALNDTWVWDGTNWTQKFPATSPSARSGFGMAYDSVRKQVVLFGGQSLTNLALGDTWTWDGANWTEQSAAASPPARFAGHMAFDAGHSDIVLFGGGNDPGGNFADLADTWSWNGSTWTQHVPKTSPTPRYAGCIAYDAASKQVVLFGGRESTMYGLHTLNETWVWDGTNWTQQFPSSSPAARIAPAMAYDSSNQAIVLFGGYNIFPPQFVGDTWTWQGKAVVSPTPSITTVLSASAFGAFPRAAPGSWIEIYGANLAPVTLGWTGADFNGHAAPTSLDGVEVMIGDQKAFIDYVSPSQIDAELPSNIATGGTLQLSVISNGISVPFDLPIDVTEPGLLAPAAFKIGANQYVVAQFADGTYVLPAKAIAGVNSRPAKPGETIIIYGVGFGTVTPDSPAGQIVTQSNQLTLPFEILFGDTPAEVPYAGLAPGLVGVYQFNVIVPQVSDGDLVPLKFNLGGVAGAQTLFTAVQQ